MDEATGSSTAAPAARSDASSDIVLAVGEALVDIVRGTDGTVSEHPGGSIANVAVTLSRLGTPTRLATWIDGDRAGRSITRRLEEAGVALVPGSTAATRTPTAVATLAEDGSATYEFDLEWVLPSGLAGPIDAGFVHTGSLAATLEPGATATLDAVTRARATALVGYDPNVRPALIDDRVAACARAERFVTVADVVRASTDDLAWLFPDERDIDVAARWLAMGPAVVVVTRGADGAYATCRDGDYVHVPGPDAVSVVDTVGAGDTFMGTLLWGLVEAGFRGAAARPALGTIGVAELRRFVATASTAAEFSVGRAGADPPTLAELRAACGPARA